MAVYISGANNFARWWLSDWTMEYVGVRVHWVWRWCRCFL